MPVTLKTHRAGILPATLYTTYKILRRASPLYGSPTLACGGHRLPPHTGGTPAQYNREEK